MPKNIFVATGSSRREGNSITLAEAFINGARESGNPVRLFHTATRDINPIREINDIWLEGKARILLDAFKDESPYIHASKILVIATPVYFGAACASIKLFLDKFYSTLMPSSKRKMKFEKIILLAVASEDEKDTFLGVNHEIKQFARYMNIPEITTILVPAVRRIGDINNTDALNKAYELGKSIK